MPGWATQVFAKEFDQVFFRLPADLQGQITAKITEMGSRLESFPHYRMSGRTEYRLRVGDYRIIDEFDLRTNQLFLLTLGHRREIYR